MIENIFSVPLYKQKLELDNKKINNLILDTSKTNRTVIKSNVNGWQSKHLHDIPELTDFINSLELHVHAYSIFMGIELKREINPFWFNVNRHKDYNLSHMHTDCKAVGIYYSKVPENSGAIYFTSPMASINMLSGIISTRSEYQINHNFFPEEGDLIIFPCWLEHGVYPNMNENEERISIGFHIN